MSSDLIVASSEGVFFVHWYLRCQSLKSVAAYNARSVVVTGETWGNYLPLSQSKSSEALTSVLVGCATVNCLAYETLLPVNC